MAVPSDLIRPADEHARSTASQAADDGNVLSVRPNHPFFLVHYADHPGNWFVGQIEAGEGVPDEDVGHWWLPKLNKERTQPGVNGNRTIGRGVDPIEAYDNAHSLIRRNGGNILPKSLGYEVARDCIDPKTRTAGQVFLEAWEKPKPKLRGKRLKFDFDRQRFLRWLLSLLRDGIIAAPDEQIVDIHLARLAERVPRRERDETKAKHIEAARADLAAAEKASVPVEEPKAPKAGKRPAAKPKADPAKDGA
jgi:hypothetical protein